MMLTKNVGMTRQLSRKIFFSFSFSSSSFSSSCQSSSLIDSSSASPYGSFFSHPLFLSSATTSSSSSTWRRSPTYILLQQRVISSSSSNKTKKEEKEKSKNQSKDNKDGKEKKKEVEEEDPFDEEALKRRAERLQKQAQIKRSNRLFWIVVFGVIFGSIAYEKQQEWADLEDERTRMNANAKLVLHVAGACLNKNIPLEFSGRALRSTDDCGEDAFFIATSSFGKLILFFCFFSSSSRSYSYCLLFFVFPFLPLSYRCGRWSWRLAF
jgi:hypothetical protein